MVPNIVVSNNLLLNHLLFSAAQLYNAFTRPTIHLPSFLWQSIINLSSIASINSFTLFRFHSPFVLYGHSRPKCSLAIIDSITSKLMRYYSKDIVIIILSICNSNDCSVQAPNLNYFNSYIAYPQQCSLHTPTHEGRNVRISCVFYLHQKLIHCSLSHNDYIVLTEEIEYWF